jgi:hypothetical protein
MRLRRNRWTTFILAAGTAFALYLREYFAWVEGGEPERRRSMGA